MIKDVILDAFASGMYVQAPEGAGVNQQMAQSLWALLKKAGYVMPATSAEVSAFRNAWKIDDTGGSTGSNTGGSTGSNTGGSTGSNTGGSTGSNTGGLDAPVSIYKNGNDEYFSFDDVGFYKTTAGSSPVSFITAYKNDTGIIYQLNAVNYSITAVDTDSDKFLMLGDGVLSKVGTNPSTTYNNRGSDDNFGAVCGYASGTGTAFLYDKLLSDGADGAEYLLGKYGHIRFKINPNATRKTIDPDKVTSMSVGSNNNGLQYAQFDYSDPPASNVYKGLETLFGIVGENANLSAAKIPCACMSTTKLSICFPANTFDTFDLEHAKDYLRSHELTFIY